MRLKLRRDLKIVYVSGLIVSLYQEFALPPPSLFHPQAAFLFLMLVPSVDKFLAREVVVEVTKLTRPTRSSPSGPALTFCPYNKSGSANNTETSPYRSQTQRSAERFT